MNELGRALSKKLLTLRHLKAQPNGSGTWINMRCPFCGDSKKDKLKKRFYVKVDFKDNEMPIVYCHNCGIVMSVQDALPVLFPDEYDLVSQFRTHSNRVRRSANAKKLDFVEKRKIKLESPPNTQYNIDKINYINDRMGVKLCKDDLLRFKMIVDFYDFLAINGIRSLTRDKRVCDKLETDYIGFLTINNDIINMRNIRDFKEDGIMKRYENYSIFDNDISRRMFILSNSVDITKTVKIVIAEGVFDIMGIYYHIKNKELNNHIYVAVCGSGYDNALRYVISQYGIIFHEIEIYSDSDKPLNYYRDVKKRLGKRIEGDIKVFYNKNKKGDFGCKKDEIDIKYTII